MPTEKVGTADERQAGEDRAWAALSAWMSTLRDFPTADNITRAVSRMNDYQVAWMNGRKRPIP